jgi:hypothetical protein
LRFNGMNKFKTSCGGLLTVCYLVQVAFITAVCLKALITGVFQNATSTTYNVVQSTAQFEGAVTITDLNLRFGFKNTASAFSSSQDSSWYSLPASIGRFELLHLYRDSDGALTYTRVNIEGCDDNSAAYCVSSG